MIHLMSQREAEQSGVPSARVQNVSPYVNPAHVLAPPRQWLEALVEGTYSWPFFRLRYKSLLRNRFQAEPERFHALLDASEGGRELVLTCHCLSDHCHRELAREFLEHLRGQRARRMARQAAPRPRRRLPPARDWAHKPHPGLVLATLIEHPQAVPGARA